MVRLAVLAAALWGLAGAVHPGAAVSTWAAGPDAVYLGTEDGRVLRYLPVEDRVEEVWRLAPVERVTGVGQPKLYGLDVRDGVLLWVREGSSGFRVVERFPRGGPPEVVVPEALQLPVVAAWFDASGYVLVLLDGEVVWVDDAGAVTRRLQVTGSAVGAADKRGRRLAVGDEGGLVTVVDLDSGKIVLQSAQHRDKVMALDLGEHWLLSGGRDRRAAALALERGDELALRAEFFVYAVALDPSERLAAYTYDDAGTLRVVDLEARSEVLRRGGFVGVDRLLFWGEDCLVLASEQGWVRCWRWRE
jgi:WD40 repeat protein